MIDGVEVVVECCGKEVWGVDFIDWCWCVYFVGDCDFLVFIYCDLWCEGSVCIDVDVDWVVVVVGCEFIFWWFGMVVDLWFFLCNKDVVIMYVGWDDVVIVECEV